MWPLGNQSNWNYGLNIHIHTQCIITPVHMYALLLSIMWIFTLPFSCNILFSTPPDLTITVGHQSLSEQWSHLTDHNALHSVAMTELACIALLINMHAASRVLKVMGYRTYHRPVTVYMCACVMTIWQLREPGHLVSHLALVSYHYCPVVPQTVLGCPKYSHDVPWYVAQNTTLVSCKPM